jgi:hypothetical protein
VGRPRANEGLGTISRAGWEGGSGKFSRMGGRAVLGAISTGVWDGVLGTVGGTRVKEVLGTLARVGWEGG